MVPGVGQDWKCEDLMPFRVSNRKKGQEKPPSEHGKGRESKNFPEGYVQVKGLDLNISRPQLCPLCAAPDVQRTHTFLGFIILIILNLNSSSTIP